MSKYNLTLGQVVDQLKDGEIAENEEGRQYTKSEYGGIGPIDEPVRNMPLRGHFIQQKWRILPKYISFDEAMVARREGKRAVLYKNGERVASLNEAGKSYALGSISMRDYTIDDLLNGQWTVEES